MENQEEIIIEKDDSIQKKAKLNYNGSIFWLIFWAIIFFPIALILFFTRCSFTLNQRRYCLHYEGSIFWPIFWAIFFFPITFVLLFLNTAAISKPE